VAAGIAAGVAEALKPGATVGGVIDVVLGELSSGPRREVEDGLAWARDRNDWKALRPLYDDRYRGHPISNAVEILSSALAVFALSDGDPEQASSPPSTSAGTATAAPTSPGASRPPSAAPPRSAGPGSR
jgi:hypothetical protein